MIYSYFILILLVIISSEIFIKIKPQKNLSDLMFALKESIKELKKEDKNLESKQKDLIFLNKKIIINTIYLSFKTILIFVPQFLLYLIKPNIFYLYLSSIGIILIIFIGFIFFKIKNLSKVTIIFLKKSFRV